MEHAEALRLRSELGFSVRDIARELNVARSTASRWVRDVSLSAEQRAALVARNPIYNNQCTGAAANAAKHRANRIRHQQHGRELAAQGDPLFAAGCMLYWAEGEKGRNCVGVSNSDPELLGFFLEFLRTCFGVPDAKVRVRCNLFADHLERQREIEAFWLATLRLPETCLNRSAVNVYSKYSQKKRANKLPYGTCKVTVCDTGLVQTIYGAIQEYGGFDRSEWLG